MARATFQTKREKPQNLESPALTQMLMLFITNYLRIIKARNPIPHNRYSMPE